MSKQFKRRRKPRLLKKTFLIVCEGHCEKIYFQNMKRCERLTNIHIEIMKPQASTPESVYQYARKEKNKKEYDVVFSVFDGDVSGYDKLRKKASRTAIELICSIPCFEIWLLLHYKYTSKEFHRCEALITNELRKHIPGYEKSQAYHSQKNFYAALRNDLSKAIKNAKRLDEENRKNMKTSGTSTEIFKIIETILEKKY